MRAASESFWFLGLKISGKCNFSTFSNCKSITGTLPICMIFSCESCRLVIKVHKIVSYKRFWRKENYLYMFHGFPCSQNLFQFYPWNEVDVVNKHGQFSLPVLPIFIIWKWTHGMFLQCSNFCIVFLNSRKWKKWNQVFVYKILASWHAPPSSAWGVGLKLLEKYLRGVKISVLVWGYIVEEGGGESWNFEGKFKIA